MPSQAQTQRLEAISRAKADRSALQYFFAALSKTKKPEKWLEDLINAGGFLNPETGPPSRFIEHSGQKGIQADVWPDLFFVENLARRNTEIRDAEVSRFLRTFIGTAARLETGRDPRNFRTEHSLLYILSLIPLEHLIPVDLEVIEHCAGSMGIGTQDIAVRLFPNVIQSGRLDLLEPLLQQVLHFRVESTSSALIGMRHRFFPVLSDHTLSEVLQKLRLSLTPECAQIAFATSKRTIEEIISKDPKQFEWYQITTIEYSQHRHEAINEYIHSLSDLLRDALTALPDADQEILQLLNSPHSIFRRQAIHAIGISFASKRQLLWNRYSQQNPLWDIETKHELFELIKKNRHELSETESTRIFAWIDELSPEMYSPEFQEKSGEKLEQRMAYDKLEWYEFAFGTETDQIREKVERLRAICDWDRQIPPGQWSTPIEDGFVAQARLLAPEKTTVRSVAEWLVTLQQLPRNEGLAIAFKEAIRIDPKRFTDGAAQIGGIDPYYLYYFFGVMREQCREQKTLDYSAIFDLAVRVVRTPGFWSRVTETEDSISSEASMIGVIAELVREASRIPEDTVSSETLEVIQEVMIEMIVGNTVHPEGAPVDIGQMQNAHGGKICLAFADTWIQIEEHRKRGGTNQNRLKDFLTTRLVDGTALTPDLEFMLGAGFRGFFYYDPEWCMGRMKLIFPDNPSSFAQSITGFLESVHNVYQDVYALFKQNGCYRRAILTSSLSSRAKESLVHQVLLGGIETGESLHDSTSLIKQIIATGDAHVLNRVSWLLWRYVEDGNAKAESFLTGTWRLILERLRALPSGAADDVVPHLLRYPDLVNTWSEDVTELIGSTLNLVSKDSFPLATLVETLEKRWSQDPHFVTNVFLAMVKNKRYPIYSTEPVKRLIENMFKEGHAAEAKEICGLYVMAGIYDLVGIQKRYVAPGE